MAGQRTDKCPYKSNFDKDLWISPSQFLAESMTARIARKDGVDLPQRFWENEKWERHFLIQLRFANSLLKIFDIKAIISALKTYKGKKVYSFGAKFILDPLIKDEQKKLDIQNTISENKSVPVEEPAVESNDGSPRPNFVSENNMSKLRGL